MSEKATEKEASKGKNSPEIKNKKKRVGDLQALATMASSAGGKILVDNLLKDVIDLADAIAMKYKTVSHAELQGYAAELEGKLLIIRLITRADWNKDVELEELKEMIAAIPEGE